MDKWGKIAGREVSPCSTCVRGSGNTQQPADPYSK